MEFSATRERQSFPMHQWQCKRSKTDERERLYLTDFVYISTRTSIFVREIRCYTSENLIIPTYVLFG